MRFNHLLLSALLFVSGAFTVGISAQILSPLSPMRGDANSTECANLALEATFESVELDLLITEMEDAGFEMDVEEGFDEEWEEEMWVGSDADDVEALTIDPDEANLLDAGESVSAYVLEEGWEETTWDDPATVLEASESFAQRGDTDAFDEELWEEVNLDTDITEFALANLEDEGAWEEEEWWNNENGYDDSWNELMEQVEMDNMESEYELEDLDMMEMMYEVQ